MLRRESLPEQLIHHPVHGNRRAAVNEQQREQCKRLSARHGNPPAIFQVDLDHRAEDPAPQIHREREPTSASPSDVKASGEKRASMQTSTIARPGVAPRSYVPWGMLAAIDLHDGDRARPWPTRPASARSCRR